MRINEFTTDDFEKVFFGNLKRNPEKDTKVEKNVYQIIRTFIKSSEPLVKDRAYKMLKNLSTLKNAYPDDLIPKAKYVYRGTRSKNDRIIKIIHQPNLMEKIVKIEDHPSEGYHSFFIKFNDIYTPKSPIQSWTTDINVGLKFMRYKLEGILLKAKVDDDFILTAEITNLITSDITEKDISPESEIIRISQKPIEVEILCSINNLQEEIKFIMIDKDPEIIQFIKNPSEKIQLVAVQHDPYVIEYIDNPTEKVRQAADEGIMY